tara:strand:+ start:264 stop:506 length:243 start_codon:yes stop_codon:yes gene_type:complete
MKKLLIVFFLTISSIIMAQDINLNYGDVHLNEWTGTFATKLDGDYSIVVNTDYENETMNAVVINNETGETYCLPRPCNYK